ncbi:MAG: hypothetical protein ABH822_02390 [Patescibacteria group bacterium]
MKQRMFLLTTILAIVALYWLGLFYDWDNAYWWFDEVLHFFGGLWLAALFVYLTDRLGLSVIRRRFWLKLILGLGFVALVGVLWEFHEFIADWFIGKMLMQGDVADTLSDLLFDLLGGLAYLLLCSYVYLLKKESTTD